MSQDGPTPAKTPRDKYSTARRMTVNLGFGNIFGKDAEEEDTEKPAEQLKDKVCEIQRERTIASCDTFSNFIDTKRK
jgi:hypothetical protein